MGIFRVPLILYVIFALLPLLGVWGLDARPGKPLARAVGVMNLTGLVHYFYYAGFAQIGGRFAFSEPAAWFFPYGGALLGWGVYVLFLRAYMYWHSVLLARKRQHLSARCEDMQRAWGGSLDEPQVEKQDKKSKILGASSVLGRNSSNIRPKSSSASNL